MQPASRDGIVSHAREEAMQLARRAYQQVHGRPVDGSSRLGLFCEALERAAQSSAFAELNPQKKLEAAVELIHSQSKLDRLREMLDSLMSNPGTLGRQVVARATRGEDLLGLALESYFPFPASDVTPAQAVPA